MSEFSNRHVLVTGASSGIGLATARLLARRGARVFLLARSEAKLAAATDAIGRDGGCAPYSGVSVERMFPELEIGRRCPRLVKWGRECGRARR